VPHDVSQVLAAVALFLLIPFGPIVYLLFRSRLHEMPAARAVVGPFAVITVAGLLFNAPALAVLGASVLAGLLLAYLWAAASLRGLAVDRECAPVRLFPGDEAELTVRVRNGKLLPLTRLDLANPIHAEGPWAYQRLLELLDISGTIEVREGVGPSLLTLTSLAPFQTLTRRYDLTARRRGVYTIEPARVASGDPFGIFNRTAVVGDRREIVVYPHVYTPEEIGLPFREVLGDAIPDRALLDDPSLIAGSREYRPGDPLNRVHWKATARTGALSVRLHDPSTSANLLIVLNLTTARYAWQGVDTDRMEAAIDAAASLAVWALDRDYPVGIRSNGAIRESSATPRVSPGASPRQATVLLDHLARLSYSGLHGAEYMLLDEMHRLEARTGIIFVTPLLSPEIISVLTQPRLANRISVVYCGRIGAPVVRGVPVYLARPAGTERAAS
jgi:uncharacterized protein (DUF58 family)